MNREIKINGIRNGKIAPAKLAATPVDLTVMLASLILSAETPLSFKTSRMVSTGASLVCSWASLSFGLAVTVSPETVKESTLPWSTKLIISLLETINLVDQGKVDSLTVSGD